MNSWRSWYEQDRKKYKKTRVRRKREETPVKNARQAVILEIIASGNIDTQNQLMKALQDRGIHTTQATLSRDIREMNLTKEALPGGGYRYVAARKSMDDHQVRLRKIFKESVISYDLAQNLFIIRTLPGLAPAACSALDSMSLAGMVGTIAGDDTAFIAMRDNDAAKALYEEIRKLL